MSDISFIYNKIINELNEIENSKKLINKEKIVNVDIPLNQRNSLKYIEYKKSFFELYVAVSIINDYYKDKPIKYQFYNMAGFFSIIEDLYERYSLDTSLHFLESFFVILSQFLSKYIVDYEDIKRIIIVLLHSDYYRNDNFYRGFFDYYDFICPQELDAIRYAWTYHRQHEYPTNIILQSNNDDLGILNVSFLTYGKNYNFVEKETEFVVNYPKIDTLNKEKLISQYYGYDLRSFNNERDSVIVKNDHFDIIYMRLRTKNLLNLDFLFKYLNGLTQEGRAYVIMPKGAFVNLGTESFRIQCIEGKWVECIVDLGDTFKDDIKTQYLLVIFSKNNEKFTFIDTKKEPLTYENENYIKKEYEIQRLNNLYATKTFSDGIKLGDYCEVIRGYQIRSKKVIEYKNRNGKYLYLKIKDLYGNKMNLDNVDSLDAPPIDSKYEIRRGDIILTTKGSHLEVVLVLYNISRPTIISNNLTIIRVRDECKDKLSAVYLYNYLTTAYGMQQLEGMQSGSAVRTISVTDLLDMEVPYCDVKKQQQFSHGYLELENEKETLLKQYEKKTKEQENNFFNLFDDDTFS